MTEVQKIKGNVFMTNVQDKTWGLIKYRQGGQEKLIRFANTCLPKTIVAGTPITAAVITQNVDGRNIPVAVNVNKTSGTTGKMTVAKSVGKKKKGTVTVVNPEYSIIMGDNGQQYIAYNVSYIPVGADVKFRDTDVIFNGFIVADQVTLA